MEGSLAFDGVEVQVVRQLNLTNIIHACIEARRPGDLKSTNCSNRDRASADETSGVGT